MCRPEKCSLTVTPGFILVIGILLFLDRGVGLLWWGMLACLVHEFGHIAVALFLRGRPAKLSLTAVGAELSFQYKKGLSYGEENLVALAGSAANVLLAFGAVCFQVWLAAILSVGVGLFNLMPVEPLDGGRVLSNILAVHLEDPWPERISTVCSGILVGLLTGAGLIVLMKYSHGTLLLTSCWLLLKTFRFPWKKRK